MTYNLYFFWSILISHFKRPTDFEGSFNGIFNFILELVSKLPFSYLDYYNMWINYGYKGTLNFGIW
jgi:hypothetical protein